MAVYPFTQSRQVGWNYRDVAKPAENAIEIALVNNGRFEVVERQKIEQLEQETDEYLSQWFPLVFRLISIDS